MIGIVSEGWRRACDSLHQGDSGAPDRSGRELELVRRSIAENVVATGRGAGPGGPSLN